AAGPDDGAQATSRGYLTRHPDRDTLTLTMTAKPRGDPCDSPLDGTHGLADERRAIRRERLPSPRDPERDRHQADELEHAAGDLQPVPERHRYVVSSMSPASFVPAARIAASISSFAC